MDRALRGAASAPAPTSGAAVCRAAIDVRPEHHRMVVARDRARARPRRGPAARRAASHSATSVDFPKPAGAETRVSLSPGAPLEAFAQQRSRHEAAALPRGIELGLEQRGWPTAHCSLGRAAPSPPARADVRSGVVAATRRNEAPARRPRWPSPADRGSVSPFTSAWTWLSISASTSGSQSQSSGVIASSNIGRNSRAIAFVDRDVGRRDR